MSRVVLLVLVVASLRACAHACSVYARTESGLVCGAVRGARGGHYASFRGVPYARQPVEGGRFQVLKSTDHYNFLNTTFEGPICPQNDVFYGDLMANPLASEACLHANIHVPLDSLPDVNQRTVRNIQPPYTLGYEPASSPGLPIFVFIHGGGFGFGSGDADFHGPENLMSKDQIVITFNYRINVFGFLSLNTSSVPGNNGLRDAIALLRWVRRNARYFGGDASRVTLGGQSAGAAAVHLLAVAPQAEGLFQRAIIMSGTAIPTFYTTSPAYAQLMATQFASLLGINATDPEEIHLQLTEKPLQDLMTAHKTLQDIAGIVVFLPVIESQHPGVKAVLDFDTEAAVASGKDSDIPLIVGYTTNECESFRPRFEEIDIIKQIEANPLLVLPPQLIFSLPPEVAMEKAKIVQKKYFKGKPTMDEFIQLCSDSYFKYPALKVAAYRKKLGGAPLYLYEFGYTADENPLKESINGTYKGAAHAEDLTYVFQVNSVRSMRSQRDEQMVDLMTSYFTNFIEIGDPTSVDRSWVPVDGSAYLRISSPEDHQSQWINHDQEDLVAFFDSLQPK